MIRTLAHFLLNPMNHFWLVLILALLFRKKKIARYLTAYAALWLFIISVSPLPSWLTAHRENRYAVLQAVPDRLQKQEHVRVLVLGGGHANAPGLPPNDQLSNIALGRLVEGIRLYRQLPGSKLVCSGYSGSSRIPQAEVMAQTAVLLGVPPADTLMIKTPAHTEAESLDYTARFGKETPFILVTDALHMPRAMFWFRQAGQHPIPAPTNHSIKPDPERRSFLFKPSIRKIDMTDRLLHEWAGTIYGRWKRNGRP